MKISIIGPGIMPIPPTGWGAVETLIWDMSNALIALGHEVDIVNVNDPIEIIKKVNLFRPDFVHIHYDDWVGLYDYIQYPCACTSHFGYLEREEMFGGYVNIANAFTQIKPRIFCLSEGIKKVYQVLMDIPEDRLFISPNGVNCSADLLMLLIMQVVQFILQRLITVRGSISFSQLIVFIMQVTLLMRDLIRTRIIWVNGLRNSYMII